MGVPPVLIHLIGIFNEIDQPFWGTPMAMETSSWPGLCHPKGGEAVALQPGLAPSFQPSPATAGYSWVIGFLMDINGILMDLFMDV